MHQYSPCDIYLSGGSINNAENRQEFKESIALKSLGLSITEMTNNQNNKPETNDCMASMRLYSKYNVFIIAPPISNEYDYSVLMQDLVQIMEIASTRGRDHLIPIFLRSSESGTISEVIWNTLQTIIYQLSEYLHIPIFYNIKSAVDHIERLEHATTIDEYIAAMNYRDYDELIYYHENELNK